VRLSRDFDDFGFLRHEDIAVIRISIWHLEKTCTFSLEEIVSKPIRISQILSLHDISQLRMCFPSQRTIGRPHIRACQTGWVHANLVQPTRPAGRLHSAFVNSLGPQSVDVRPAVSPNGPVRKQLLFFSSAHEASFQSPTPTAGLRLH
jgi:hypothetical protein